MIDFELPDAIVAAQNEMREIAQKHMRPIAREYDEKEHEKPWDYINFRWEEIKKDVAQQLSALEQTDEERAETRKKTLRRLAASPWS